MKTLITRNREEKEKYRVPRRAQDTIPIRTIWPDGVFLVGKDRYSKTFQFQDINYAVASLDDKKAMFMDYSTLLNSLDSGATAKLTIHNHRMSRSTVSREGWIPHAEDGLDRYRDEYNQMLTDKVSGSDAFCQDKFLTITVTRRSIADARSYFARVSADLSGQFAHLGSKCEALNAEARLKLLRDVLQEDSGDNFHFSLKESMGRGHSFVDAICPSGMTIKWKHFTVDGKFGRVMFLRDYASYIKDSLVTELTALNREVLLSIDILPVPMDEAIKEVNKRSLGTEANGTHMLLQDAPLTVTIPYTVTVVNAMRFDKEMQTYMDSETIYDTFSAKETEFYATYTFNPLVYAYDNNPPHNEPLDITFAYSVIGKIEDSTKDE